MANIILIGFMGAGKTSFGKWLAKNKDMDFMDTDAVIEDEAGISINEIFDKHGEEYFRNLETGLMERFIDEGADNIVLSVGGGLPVREINRQLLKKLGNVVYLRASADTLCKRLEGDGTRPLLKGGDLRTRITGLMEKREKLYDDAATVYVDTDDRSFEEILKILEEKLS